MSVRADAAAFAVARLEPFGVEVRPARAGAALEDVPAAALEAWVLEHRVAVLRGFAELPDAALPAYCRRLGEVLEWEFGAVNDLRVREDAKNYIYTSREVPFHWDGAFAGKVPSFIFFACVEAPPPGTGGETTFADAVRLVAAAPAERRAVWEKVAITYATEKVVHYGGTFTAPLLGRHPRTGAMTLRFAEPVRDLNPVTLEVAGIPAAEHAGLLADLRARLYDPALCLAHAWRAGDVVIADNHALLHGRRAFSVPGRRHIRRVNIL
jgi:alpha-ketoglutarate-dependent taurine dioxygenase